MKARQLFLGRWKMLVIVLMVSGVAVVELGVAGEKVSVTVLDKKGPDNSAETSRDIKTQTFADIEFVWIEPGTFMMGSPESEKSRQSNEGPQHRVTLTQGFWMGKYEVTQAQWESLMGNNPSGQVFPPGSGLTKEQWESIRGIDPAAYRGSDKPVENVSWRDTQAFIHKLNGLDKGTFRLPTEAEWEYACRAGSTTRYCFGDDRYDLDDFAWYGDTGATMCPVGQKLPNAWGLYDMHGNVREWCQDWWEYYSPDPITDPTGPTAGALRILRGGSYYHPCQDCRSAARDGTFPDDNASVSLGFRIVRNP